MWTLVNGILSPVTSVTKVLLTRKVRLSDQGLAYVDYNFGVDSLGRAASAPDLVSIASTNIQTLGFDGGTTMEQVFGSIEMNHDWLEGSIVYPHIHWMPTTTGAGSVKWQLEYVVLQDGGTASTSNTSTVTQAAGGVAWKQLFANLSPTINLVGYTIGAQLFFRLFRDPGEDDYADDAALCTFGIHVQVDGFGSAQAASKD